MVDKTADAQALIDKMPTFDISDEAWREYDYGNGKTLRVYNAKTLILEKKVSGNRHRLIVINEDLSEVGMYIAPGWLAIRWQTPDHKHGITF